MSIHSQEHVPPHDRFFHMQDGIAPLIETDIPARLERLPWGRFHTLIVIALGVTWILDGLEVTLAGAVAGALKESPRLQFSNTQVGLASSFYLAGAVFGALCFGWLTDRLGRKRLFSITLSLYLVATAATGLSWDIYSFSLFRFLTGAGIGGEYTAIASTIRNSFPGEISRMDRPRHQWQFLDWCGDRGGGLPCAARSCVDAPGFRLALRLLNRSTAWTGHPIPEDLDPESRLAG